MTLQGLGEHVAQLGFTGIELPVRPGYQVPPESVERELPDAAKILADRGVRIESVAGPTDERTMDACAAAGVPIIRICVQIGPEGYLAAESRLQREFDALLPLLEKHGITLGIQNHCGDSIGSALGLRSLLNKYDPRRIAAVWDAAHNALNGEEPDHAIDIIWSHLCMVNLKNAFWKRINGPEAVAAQWRPYWTTGRHGLASWPRVVAELKKRGYAGVVCLTAEYDDHDSVDRLIAEDLNFARSLFEEPASA